MKMRKTASAILLCAVIATAALAQTGSGRRAGFQASLIYPSGTNGVRATQYTNKVSLNVLAGISRNEEAVTLGGLANIILHDATGLQAAGLYNHTGNDGTGVALSGLASYAGHDYRGLQVAGLANVVLHGASGLRVAGLYNHAGGDGRGFSLAGLANYTGRAYSGLQVAGLVNVAGSIQGVQLSPLVNVAGNVRGVQLAGLVNVAAESDYPIGLVNLIRNGEKSIAVACDETGSLAISFRSGGRVTYGIIGYGYTLKGWRKAFFSEGGLGAHIRLAPRFRLNSELRLEVRHASANATIKAGCHWLAACRIAPHVEIFAGPGIHYMYSDDVSDTGLFPRHSLWKKHGSGQWQQVYAGFRLGMQYVF
jgi:hypothetical protein